jgi:hypothetical protein|tara:strand:- start:2128 stop:2448 length:321 start_codon:yes stop_codon:yes gene_type:complete
MILSIIGIIIGIIAIGLIFHFRKEYKMSIHFLEGEAEASEHGYTALMKDFTNYQVETDRKITHLEKQLEIQTNGTGREIEKLKKDLPNTIRGVIGHIEFARPLDKK